MNGLALKMLQSNVNCVLVLQLAQSESKLSTNALMSFYFNILVMLTRFNYVDNYRPGFTDRGKTKPG